mmetsp:Transcript_35326/g.112412  ORF Transcript_35326/g.112412 Transcript_35326/m.112412 type:complete len:206 (+) Transcript_35326:2538-3155(+)
MCTPRPPLLRPPLPTSSAGWPRCATPRAPSCHRTRCRVTGCSRRSWAPSPPESRRSSTASACPSRPLWSSPRRPQRRWPRAPPAAPRLWRRRCSGYGPRCSVCRPSWPATTSLTSAATRCWLPSWLRPSPRGWASAARCSTCSRRPLRLSWRVCFARRATPAQLSRPPPPRRRRVSSPSSGWRAGSPRRPTLRRTGACCCRAATR